MEGFIRAMLGQAATSNVLGNKTNREKVGKQDRFYIDALS